MRLAAYRWLGPVPACVALQSSFGAFYATGVFTSRLHSASVTYALGVAAGFLSLAIMGAGLLLHRLPPPRSPARPLAVGAAALLLAGAALPSLSGPALYAAAAALGAGYGAVYVVSLAVLQAWVPERPGTAAGAAVTAGGVGTLVYVALNTLLSSALGSPAAAMRAAALVQAGVAIVAAAAVDMPPSADWHPSDEDPAVAASVGAHPWEERYADELPAFRDLEAPSPRVRVRGRTASSGDRPTVLADATGERTPLLGKQHHRGEARVQEEVADSMLGTGAEAPDSKQKTMTVREMIADPAFYMLLFTVAASVGPGFGVVLHGSRMQHVMFGVWQSSADARFFGITLVGVAGRLFVGLVVDAIAAATTRAAGKHDAGAGDGDITLTAAFGGARIVNVALLFMQVLALALMVPVIHAGLAGVFAVLLSVIYLTFSGSAVVTACLCRATFAPQNSTLAFSLIGLAIGVGDVAFSSLVASCAKANPLASADALTSVADGGPAAFDFHDHIRDYDSFVFFSLAFSMVGWAASILLAPGKFVSSSRETAQDQLTVEALRKLIRSPTSGNLANVSPSSTAPDFGPEILPPSASWHSLPLRPMGLEDGSCASGRRLRHAGTVCRWPKLCLGPETSCGSVDSGL